ncbi:hypothetical protein QBC39DRAFT_94887 [Podospora conica]|nr:hypothetical protein QBC39DRAFT_94887 [Schizothecium conicum]
MDPTRSVNRTDMRALRTAQGTFPSISCNTSKPIGARRRHSLVARAPVRLPRRAVNAYRHPAAKARTRQSSILGFDPDRQPIMPSPSPSPRSVPPHMIAVQSMQVRPAGPAGRAQSRSWTPWHAVLRNRPASDERPPTLSSSPPLPSHPLVTRLQPAGARPAGDLSIQSAPRLSPSLSRCIQDMLPARQFEAICWPPSCASSPAHGGRRVHIRPSPVSHRGFPSISQADQHPQPRIPQPSQSSSPPIRGSLLFQRTVWRLPCRSSQ